MSKEIKLEITAATPEIIEKVALKIIEITGLDKALDETIKKSMIGKIYTAKEVADIVGKKHRTILKHIDLEILKANKPGKSYQITQTQLENYVKSNPSSSN